MALLTIQLTPRPVRPWLFFTMTLCLVFAVEYAVMHVLPLALPAEHSATFAAVTDAVCLTVVTAPVLWGLVAVPLQRLATSRMHLLKRALSIQEDERRRITRDLHDGIGQVLTTLMLGLRALEETSREPAVQQQARDLRQLGAKLHEEVRLLVRGLRPTILDQTGLAPALTRLLDDLIDGSPIRGHLHVSEGFEQRLPSEIETALFRIAQEAVVNAVTHGAPSQIDLFLETDHGQIVLEIRDDGTGFDAAEVLRGRRISPFGLLSIRERAMILNGTATIASQPGLGTRVIVRIPSARDGKADA